MLEEREGPVNQRTSRPTDPTSDPASRYRSGSEDDELLVPLLHHEGGSAVAAPNNGDAREYLILNGALMPGTGHGLDEHIRPSAGHRAHQLPHRPPPLAHGHHACAGQKALPAAAELVPLRPHSIHQLLGQGRQFPHQLDDIAPYHRTATLCVSDQPRQAVHRLLDLPG